MTDQALLERIRDTVRRSRGQDLSDHQLAEAIVGVIAEPPVTAASRPPMLLGMAGPAGAGKDFVASKIRRLFPGSERVALADELRCELEEILGVPRGSSLVWAKPYSEPLRWVLQQYGTEFRRSMDPDYWVSRAAATLDALDAPLVTVTDVRFRNEADMIRRRGGLIVIVKAHEEVRRARLHGHLPPDHASEQPLEGEAVVYNSSTPVASVELLEYLGLPRGCTKCTSLEPHPWHDDGSSWPEHSYFPSPVSHAAVDLASDEEAPA